MKRPVKLMHLVWVSMSAVSATRNCKNNLNIEVDEIFKNNKGR
jgi:hypothetical protein